MPFRWHIREDHLHDYAVEIRSAAQDIIGKSVLDIQAKTVTASPVDTGQLKTGWQAITPDPADWKVVGGIGTNVEHAAYVELGTGRAGAASQYPFTRSARYTPGWPGMRARAMLGNAAASVLPATKDALQRLQHRMRRL